MLNAWSHDGVVPELSCDTTKTYTAAAGDWLMRGLANAVGVVTGLSDAATDLDRSPRRARAVERARSSGAVPADPSRTKARDVASTVLGVGVLVVGVWLWLR